MRPRGPTRPRLRESKTCFRFIGHWDEKSGSPRNAMLVQGAIALALVALGAIQNAGFKGLVEYSLPVFWAFFMLSSLAFV